jgi:hypothetical protein
VPRYVSTTPRCTEAAERGGVALLPPLRCWATRPGSRCCCLPRRPAGGVRCPCTAQIASLPLVVPATPALLVNSWLPSAVADDDDDDDEPKMSSGAVLLIATSRGVASAAAAAAYWRAVPTTP